MIVEVCCGSYEDARNAYEGGAHRIELNSALYLGGLTPSLASLKLIKEEMDICVIAMVRVRGAGFCYSDNEFKQMLVETEDLLKAGADGIAFGILDKNGNIDIERNSKIIKLIKSYGKEVVFHRAFDCVKEPYESIEILIKMGVDRLLTSGLKPKALEGAQLLYDLQKKYGSQIELLAGSGINDTNVIELIDKTKITQVHSSCKSWEIDPTTSLTEVSYAYHESNDYDVVSVEKVKLIVEEVSKRNHL